MPNEKDKKLIRSINYVLKLLVLEDGPPTIEANITLFNITKELTANMEYLRDPASSQDVESKVTGQIPHNVPLRLKTDVIPDQVFLLALKMEIKNPILKVSFQLLLEALKRQDKIPTNDFTLQLMLYSNKYFRMKYSHLEYHLMYGLYM